MLTWKRILRRKRSTVPRRRAEMENLEPPTRPPARSPDSGSSVTPPAQRVEVTHRHAEPSIAEATALLERHYGEPVRPVSRYCSQLAAYAAAMDEAIKNYDHEKGGACGPFTLEQAVAVRDGLRALYNWRSKSNLLYRLLILDQPLRTKKCPRHKGRWSGCNFFGTVRCECEVGADVTGWLP